MHTPGLTASGYSLLLTVQVIFLIVFGFFTDYADELLPEDSSSVLEAPAKPSHVPSYPRKFSI